MQRRNALKKIGLVSAGIFLLPSCEFSTQKKEEAVQGLKIEKYQESLLKSLVDVMIPAGEFKGASELKVENFVWIMIKDTYDELTQSSFIRGLSAFEEIVKEQETKSFEALTEKEKLTVLYRLQDELQANSDLATFMKISKNLTIQGYLQSQYIMTEVMPYQLVPGGHGNCESVVEKEKINIYA